MHLTDVMCNRNISTKLKKQSVQDGYKTSHGVSWCRMLGSSKEKEAMKFIAVTKCRPRATVAANVGHAQQVN